jgi:hypothetical protein
MEETASRYDVEAVWLEGWAARQQLLSVEMGNIQAIQEFRLLGCYAAWLL